jgi:nucleoside-diphosphate-sugar epimerase
LQLPKYSQVTGADNMAALSVIGALLQWGLPFDFTVVAVVRDLESETAKSLAKDMHVIQGTPDDPEHIFRQARDKGKIWAMVLVTDMKNDKASDLHTAMRHGTDLIDAAVANGVEHTIYMSTDRGGTHDSLINIIPVDDMRCQLEIEEHLIWTTNSSTVNMKMAIVRSTMIMQNLTPDYSGRLFARAWAEMGDVRLQLVSVYDLGNVALHILEAMGREGSRYQSEMFSISGDDLTFAEANEAFLKVYGRPIPKTSWLEGKMLSHRYHPRFTTLECWPFVADPHCILAERYALVLTTFETFLQSLSGRERFRR